VKNTYVQKMSLHRSIKLLCVRFQVKAVHRYAADDVDELSFDAGEIISVIAFEEPDEQARNL